MDMNILIILAVLFLLGYANKIVCPKLNLPEVTGYVIIGALVSAVAGVTIGMPKLDNILESIEIISSIALGIIGFSIGIELKLNVIKKLGSSIFFIVLFEVFGGFIIVAIASKIFGFQTYTALLLGSVAAATAPAATVAIIRQYKSKGELTSTILAVVGIDDAVALIVYVLAAGFAASMVTGEQLHVLHILLKVAISLITAISIGGISGFVYCFAVKNLKSQDTMEMLLVAFIFLLLGLSEIFGVSELLTIMTFGAFVTNLSEIITRKSEHIIEKFNGVFVGAFFIAGGAYLDFGLVKLVLSASIIFFVARTFGKIFGAKLGATLGKASPKVKKHIGVMLLPQVGVGVALVISIKKQFAGVEVHGIDIGTFIFNILLLTTLLTEFIGPVLTKRALIAAKEIKEGSEVNLEEEVVLEV